jgi:L-fuculose-phosphate aldolase
VTDRIYTRTTYITLAGHRSDMEELPFQGARTNVSDLGREMLELGLTTGTGGNVSERAADNRIAISPTRVPYREIEPADVPVVDLDGSRIHGDVPASSELPMHRMVYRVRPDAGGMVHTHSTFASVFAALGRPIPPSHYLLAYVGREVSVAGYATPGSEALGELAVEALGEDCNACLLQNHGVLAVGESGAAALENASMVEYCAKVHLFASMLGEPLVLSDADVEELLAGFEEYRESPSG